MLLMVEKDIWGGICHAIHRYAKENNKYMKNYDKDTECNSVEPAYLVFLDADNQHGWEMSQNYVIHMTALKQALNHELIFKKVHEVIQFNQQEWLKPYIDMNPKLRTEVKNDF